MARNQKRAPSLMRLSQPQPRQARPWRSAPRRLRPSAGRLATATALLGLAAVFGTCRSVPVEQPADRLVVEPADDESLSADRAWRHLIALTDIGPRVSGTEGAARARAYIRAQLEDLGLEVVEHRSQVLVASGRGTLELVHLTSIIPGGAPDFFLLAAPYDTHPFADFDFVGANEGASGPALLLELGRILVRRPLPYTVALTFLDGEALADDSAAGDSRLLGSRELVRQLEREGSLSMLRLAVFFNQVADSDLEIARDLRSHRMYREVFWEAAEALGHGEAFPLDRGFGSPTLAHLSFLDRGVRSVVAIADDRFGGEYSPGVYWRTAYDTPERCSPQSLEVVGTVTLAALERIGSRLRKIDRFVHSPPNDYLMPDVPDQSPNESDQAGTGEQLLEERGPGELEPARTEPAPPASP